MRSRSGLATRTPGLQEPQRRDPPGSGQERGREARQSPHPRAGHPSAPAHLPAGPSAAPAPSAARTHPAPPSARPSLLAGCRSTGQRRLLTGPSGPGRAAPRGTPGIVVRTSHQPRRRSRAFGSKKNYTSQEARGRDPFLLVLANGLRGGSRGSGSVGRMRGACFCACVERVRPPRGAYWEW